MEHKKCLKPPTSIDIFFLVKPCESHFRIDCKFVCGRISSLWDRSIPKISAKPMSSGGMYHDDIYIYTYMLVLYIYICIILYCWQFVMSFHLPQFCCLEHSFSGLRPHFLKLDSPLILCLATGHLSNVQFLVTSQVEKSDSWKICDRQCGSFHRDGTKNKWMHQPEWMGFLGHNYVFKLGFVVCATKY